jgi:Asp-tRNA(Asn)/Glu-tRNA(Gln) amidotransferase A subunit family amidase
MLPAGRLAEHGCLTRTVSDAWTYLDVVSGGAFGRASRWDAPGLNKAVWSPDLGYADVDPEIAAIASRAFRHLVSAANLTCVDAQVQLLDPRDGWLAHREPGPASGNDSPETVRNQQVLKDLLDGRTVLATPTTPNRPHGHAGPGPTYSVALTWLFNLTGHPAITVPAGSTGDGCPVGLQLVGGHGQDQDLLRLATWATGESTASLIRDEQPRGIR